MWAGMYEDLVGFNQKPSFAKVEIEELDSDLTSGVRLLPLERVRHVSDESAASAWVDTFYAAVVEENFDEDHYEFLLVLESTIHKEDSDNPSIWNPFSSSEIQDCVAEETYYHIRTQKFDKCVQKFLVKLSEKAQVPYLQFYCKAKKAKCLDSAFKEGGVMTMVIKHPDYPVKWPQPAVITVQPSADQTYVPMINKQRLIVVGKETEEIEFKSHPNSTIVYNGEAAVSYGLKCHTFECKKASHWTESIILQTKKKKKEFKTVLIPAIEKDAHWPIILNPQKNSIVYAHNCDGLIIRFWKNNSLPIVVGNHCPARALFVNENAQYVERRIEILRPRPYFYLKKKEHSWIIC